jgi:hypothetical protein
MKNMFPIFAAQAPTPRAGEGRGAAALLLIGSSPTLFILGYMVITFLIASTQGFMIDRYDMMTVFVSLPIGLFFPLIFYILVKGADHFCSEE